jgi:hypothetical protein
MKIRLAMTAAASLFVAVGGAPRAHHSGSMYSTTPVWVQGTIVRFDPIDPHTLITVEQRSDDGQVHQWVVEGPGQSELDRIRGETDRPTVGDKIKFCAFPYKPAGELARLFPGTDFSTARVSAGAAGSSPQFVAGHVIETGGGDKQLWEPHGTIGECIRSSDEDRQVWLNFIDSNARVSEAWCRQKAYAHVRQTASLAALVNEVDRMIESPCN